MLKILYHITMWTFATEILLAGPAVPLPSLLSNRCLNPETPNFVSCSLMFRTADDGINLGGSLLLCHIRAASDPCFCILLQCLDIVALSCELRGKTRDGLGWLADVINVYDREDGMGKVDFNFAR